MTALAHHLIFDLDGTLVDSAPVIVATLNDMLSERGSTSRMDVETIRPWLSWGGPALISRVFQVEGDDAARELADFRARYADRGTPAECVFNGVREGLRDLAALGFSFAICSNKPQYLCERVLEDVGLAHHFPVIVGSAADLKQKPAPDLMHLVLRKLQARPSQSLLIGDSDVDHAAAQAVGVPFRLVTYGYAPADWDTSGIVQFSRFEDLVQSFRLEEAPRSPLRKAA
jgi:phosphoglycolate phosphatase